MADPLVRGPHAKQVYGFLQRKPRQDEKAFGAPRFEAYRPLAVESPSLARIPNINKTRFCSRRSARPARTRSQLDHRLPSLLPIAA